MLRKFHRPECMSLWIQVSLNHLYPQGLSISIDSCSSVKVLCIIKMKTSMSLLNFDSTCGWCDLKIDLDLQTCKHRSVNFQITGFCKLIGPCLKTRARAFLERIFFTTDVDNSKFYFKAEIRIWWKNIFLIAWPWPLLFPLSVLIQPPPTPFTSHFKVTGSVRWPAAAAAAAAAARHKDRRRARNFDGFHKNAEIYRSHGKLKSRKIIFDKNFLTNFCRWWFPVEWISSPVQFKFRN